MAATLTKDSIWDNQRLYMGRLKAQLIIGNWWPPSIWAGQYNYIVQLKTPVTTPLSWVTHYSTYIH